MSLKEADRILDEYIKPNSLIDNGNLFSAVTEYQKAYAEVAEKYMDLSDKYVTRVNEVIELKEENKHLNIYTCYKCSDKKTCQYAYDAYNTNDDCLAIK